MLINLLLFLFLLLLHTHVRPVNIWRLLVIHFPSYHAVVSSQLTALLLSSMSWSDCRPSSHRVSVHVTTAWFMVCCSPQYQRRHHIEFPVTARASASLSFQAPASTPGKLLTTSADWIPAQALIKLSMEIRRFSPPHGNHVINNGKTHGNPCDHKER